MINYFFGTFFCTHLISSVDCYNGGGGCGGGWPTDAMNWIISQGGQDTESSYPYTGQGFFLYLLFLLFFF